MSYGGTKLSAAVANARTENTEKLVINTVLKVEVQHQLCPLLFDLQNQVRYVTAQNCIKIQQVVFKL